MEEFMRYFVIAVLALGSACGWYPLRYNEGPTTHYTWGCLDVDSAIPLNQTKLTANFLETRKHFAEAGVMPEEKFCDAFGSIPVAVNPNRHLGSSDTATGQYSRLKGIEVNHAMIDMGHELLHAKDFADTDFLTFTHDGWRERGYWELAWLTERDSQNPDTRPSQPEGYAGGEVH